MYKKLPNKNQLNLYYKLRKKGISVKLASNLMKNSSLAKKIIRFKRR